MNKEIKMISLFAGAGGIDIGFEKAGIKTIWKNEFDKNALITLNLNNKNNANIVGEDIMNVNIDDIPSHDVLTAGFPCQPFSLAGNKKGFNDPRGKLIFKVLDIIDKKDPEVVFLENVKNLVSINEGRDLSRILEELEERGYFSTWKVLNTSKHANIPQNRERLFIVGFKDLEKLNNYKWPDEKKLTKSISDILLPFDDKYIYDEKYERVFKELSKISDDDLTTSYQWRRHYVRKNKSNIFPTLTANMGTGGHNVPLIKQDKKWRKISPREAFNLQGYPKSFKLPDISDSHLYKQAGNSVTVPLIKAIADEILKVM